MINRETKPHLTAQWTRVVPTTDRWHELHTLLSRSPGTALYGWAARSSMICKWRAVPAGVSAAATAAMR
jgi:hypothetical protein